MDIKNDIQKLQDPEIKKILSNMYTMIEEKDKVIHSLQNRVTDLELRMSEQERYSSKDCLIFNNAPITQDGNLWNQMASFITDFMGYKIQPGAFKACHVLGRGHGNKPPAVIIKFLYFHDKNEVYLRRPMLASKKNPLNYGPIFVSERLPKHDLEVKRYATEKGLITTTRNCQVRVFYKDENGARISFPVNNKSSVDSWAETAMKKMQRNTTSRAPDNNNTSFDICSPEYKRSKNSDEAGT